MSSRKILIAAIVLVLIVFAVGIYFLFFSSKATPGQTQAGQTGTLPSAGDQTNASSGNGVATTGNGATLEKNFGAISTQPVLAYFIDANNDALTIQPDGEIDETTGGQTSVLNSLLVSNIISAGFSYDGSKVFVNFGNPADPQTSIFDIAAKAWTPMSPGWQSPVWSPSDDRVAYAIANSNGTEVFSTLDTSNPKAKAVALLTLHAEDLSLAWLNKNQLVVATKSSALVGGSSWLFNISDGALTPVAVETPGLETAWSNASFNATTAMGLEFSAAASGLGGSLQLIDTSGNALQQIKFLTLPSKCAFASATSTGAVAPSSTTATSFSYLYCAVPRDQSDLAFDRLPDAYNQMSLFTADDVYRIDLSSGAVDTVFNDQTQNLDASDLKIFNNTVFFINRYDQKLYAITLLV